MAGGALIVTVDDYSKLEPVAQQILCWAATAANVAAVQVQHSPGGNKFAIRVPEENFGAGALNLKRGGANLVAGYVAGSVVVVDAANGQALSRNVNGCPATTNQPTTTGAPPVVLNVGGNPRTITLNYANTVANGTVNIYWGDGTSSLAQAESGAINHTYPDLGSWKIRIEDVSNPADFVTFTIKI